MNTLYCYYSRNTFDLLKKYVFSTYDTQPKRMIIESDYCFVSLKDGIKTLTSYKILEIIKSESVKIRLLENDHSIGFWETIISMSLQGTEYNSLVLGSNKNVFKFDRSDMMYPDTQKIRFLDFSNECCSS